MAERIFTNQELKETVERPRTEAELAWLEAYHGFCGRRAYETDRPIIITPFDGYYGRGGVVIAVNGSPMRGTMLVKSHYPDDAPQGMYVLDSDRSPKRLKSPELYRAFTKARSVKLWRTTVRLLIERGLLSEKAIV